MPKAAIIVGVFFVAAAVSDGELSRYNLDQFFFTVGSVLIACGLLFSPRGKRWLGS